MSDVDDMVEILNTVKAEIKRLNTFIQRHFGATKAEQNKTLRLLKDLHPEDLRAALWAYRDEKMLPNIPLEEASA